MGDRKKQFITFLCIRNSLRTDLLKIENKSINVLHNYNVEHRRITKQEVN